STPIAAVYGQCPPTGAGRAETSGGRNRLAVGVHHIAEAVPDYVLGAPVPVAEQACQHVQVPAAECLRDSEHRLIAPAVVLEFEVSEHVVEDFGAILAASCGSVHRVACDRDRVGRAAGRDALAEGIGGGVDLLACGGAGNRKRAEESMRAVS